METTQSIIPSFLYFVSCKQQISGQGVCCVICNNRRVGASLGRREEGKYMSIGQTKSRPNQKNMLMVIVCDDKVKYFFLESNLER